MTCVTSDLSHFPLDRTFPAIQGLFSAWQLRPEPVPLMSVWGRASP